MAKNPGLHFPDRLLTKIIALRDDDIDVVKQKILDECEKMNVDCDSWSYKFDKSGKYISYSVYMTFQDEKSFRSTYQKLQSYPEIKYVL
jgi:putative lipoic acid-binding regulatory protein